jgi:hypothetical protein
MYVLDLGSILYSEVCTDLEPAFDSIRVPGTVEEDEVVNTNNVQRDYPKAFTILLMTTANKVVLKTDPCSCPLFGG